MSDRVNDRRVNDRRVWVLDGIQHDVSSAEAFGKVCRVLDPAIPIINFRDIQDALNLEVFNIADKDDLIILTGPLTIVSVLISMWYDKFGICRILYWSSSKNHGHGGFREWFWAKPTTRLARSVVS